jgi:hypothetical protein
MRAILTYTLVFHLLGAFSQRIVNFNVSLVNSQNQSTSSQVLVRFSLTAGQSCPGYEILHCTDSVNYLQIYNFAGICGDPSTELSYSFLHGSPAFNQTNFYKISIPGFETSQPQRIFVGEQAPQSSLYIYPNPVFLESIVNLKFRNYGGGYVDGYIYNQHGVRLRSISFNVKLSEVQLDINELNDGLYIIWLTDGKSLFRGKFIVKRP